jgi:phosphoenolpyruvate synthase/pyruvate phosphate dikinase
VTLDLYITTPSGVLPEAHQGTKQVAMVPNAGGDTSQHVVEREGWCLNEARCASRCGLGAACARLFGLGQDIEWALAERRTWLLRSRPVTT